MFSAVGMLVPLVGMYTDRGSKVEEIDTTRLNLKVEHHCVKIVTKLEHLSFSKSPQDVPQPSKTNPIKLVIGSTE